MQGKRSSLFCSGVGDEEKKRLITLTLGLSICNLNDDLTAQHLVLHSKLLTRTFKNFQKSFFEKMSWPRLVLLLLVCPCMFLKCPVGNVIKLFSLAADANDKIS